MAEVASQVNIEKALAIPGWMSERELTWLATQARRCDTIIEVGSYYGRSTRALADNTYGVVICIDPWAGEMLLETGEPIPFVNTYVMPEFLYNLKDHIHADRVLPRRMFFSDFEYSGLVDMVFLDDDHRYNKVSKHIDKALSMVRIGGIISGHDYGHPTWPGVKQAVDERFPNAQIEDMIWWIRKS